MIKRLVMEIRKNCYLPFIIISILGIIITFFSSVGFTSYSGKTYTVIELYLQAKPETLLSSIEFNRFDIWTRPFGSSSDGILIPFLLGIGYTYVTSIEKETGFINLEMFRQKKREYCIIKVLGAYITGAIIMVSSMAIYGVIIYSRFPAISQFEDVPIDLIYSHNTFLVFLNAAIYGSHLMFIPVITSIYIKDKYLLLSIPIIAKFSLSQIYLRLLVEGYAKGSIKLCEFIGYFSIDSICKNTSMTGYLIYCGKTVVVFLLLVILMKRFYERSDNYGIE